MIPKSFMRPLFKSLMNTSPLAIIGWKFTPLNSCTHYKINGLSKSSCFFFISNSDILPGLQKRIYLFSIFWFYVILSHGNAPFSQSNVTTFFIQFLDKCTQPSNIIQCQELDREACRESNKCQWYSASAGCAGQSPECVGEFREDACAILPGCHWSKHPGFCSEKK